MLVFYGRRLLAPHPVSYLEDHPLSVVIELLIQYISGYLPYLEVNFSILNLRMCQAMVTRDPLGINY
jgi:hypothetical protein